MSRLERRGTRSSSAGVARLLCVGSDVRDDHVSGTEPTGRNNVADLQRMERHRQIRLDGRPGDLPGGRVDARR